MEGVLASVSRKRNIKSSYAVPVGGRLSRTKVSSVSSLFCQVPPAGNCYLSLHQIRKRSVFEKVLYGMARYQLVISH